MRLNPGGTGQDLSCIERASTLGAGCTKVMNLEPRGIGAYVMSFNPGSHSPNGGAQWTCHS